jgi:biopolymer transport protein ExbD
VPEDITGRVVLSVNKDGDLFYGLMPVTLDELEEHLSLDVEADPEVKIQIRADGDVKYEVNEKVIKVCAKAGAQDLIYSAYEE